MDGLEAYLDQQHQQGKVESRGEFTVALEKAREKLQKFQLADPSFYLLKVFQAAVASGTRRVDTQFARKRLSLWFSTDEPPFSFAELVEGMRDVLGLAPSPLRHMAIGINASLVTDPAQVCFAWWSGDQGQALAIREGLISLVDAPPRPHAVEPANNLYAFQLSKRWGSVWMSGVAHEHAAVCARCGFAPVRITIDSRPLRTRWRACDRYTAIDGITKPFHLVERVEPDPTGPVIIETPPQDWYAGYESGWVRQARERETHLLQGAPQTGEPVRCRRAYAIPVNLAGPDTVTFVRDGVLLNARTVRSDGIGATALVPGEGMSLDLSEFQVAEDRACKTAVREVEATWAEMLGSLDPDLRRLQAVPTVGPAAKRKLLAAAAKGGSGGGIGLTASYTALCHLSPLFVWWATTTGIGLGLVLLLGAAGGAAVGTVSHEVMIRMEESLARLDRQLRDAVKARLSSCHTAPNGRPG